MQISLKAARVNAGLTLADAAKKLGVAPLTLSHYENGVTFPDVLKIKKIEKIYCVAFSDITFTAKK